jgi:hypothetical protein
MKRAGSQKTRGKLGKDREFFTVTRNRGKVAFAKIVT